MGLLWAYVYICSCVSECVRACVKECISECVSTCVSECVRMLWVCAYVLCVWKRVREYSFFFSDEGIKERNDFGRQFIPFKCGSPLRIRSIQSRTFGKMWSELFKITILAELVLVPLWFSTFWVILRVFTMIIQWNSVIPNSVIPNSVIQRYNETRLITNKSTRSQAVCYNRVWLYIGII